MIMTPVIILIVVAFFMVAMAGSLFGGCSFESDFYYDENAMQDYAYKQYVSEFGGMAASDAYEDNLLIAFLTDETADGYYAIAFVGDNLRDEVSAMFGNEYTEFGRAMQNTITDHHEYSLSSDLATVMRSMAQHVTALKLESNFYTATDHTGAVKSHLTNHSALAMNEATVERALAEFTEQTGIPAVIVVEDMADVMPRDASGTAWSGIGIILLVIVAIVAIVAIVNTLRGRKKATAQPGDAGYSQDDAR